MIIGITGGTGCGKTTLLEVVKELGGTVIDCDAVYHRLLTTDPSLPAAIEAQFPGTVENGTLNRKKLGSIVFADPAALEKLNKITHSAIKQEVQNILASNPPLAAIDAIALFESGLSELCKLTMAVIAPREERIARLMARDGITREYAIARINAQPTEEFFRKKCDYVLENNSSIHSFQEKCLAFFNQLGIMKV